MINVVQPTHTYYVDFQNKVARGTIDGQDAMKQAIFKILATDLLAHRIYDDQYGFEMTGLLGKDRDLIRCEIKRRIKDALLVDKRIKNVSHFVFRNVEFSSDAVEVSFAVDTKYGIIQHELEVNLNEY